MSTFSLLAEHEMEKSTYGSIKSSGSKKDNRTSVTSYLLDSWYRCLQPKFYIVWRNFFRNSQPLAEQMVEYPLSDTAFPHSQVQGISPNSLLFHLEVLAATNSEIQIPFTNFDGVVEYATTLHVSKIHKKVFARAHLRPQGMHLLQCGKPRNKK